MASGLATLTNWTALTFTLEYCKWMLRLMLLLGECEERRDAEADAEFRRGMLRLMPIVKLKKVMLTLIVILKDFRENEKRVLMMIILRYMTIITILRPAPRNGHASRSNYHENNLTSINTVHYRRKYQTYGYTD